MRGFRDNIPPLSYAIEHIRSVFEKHSKKFGNDFIDLPLVEEADLYFRTSGEASDVCNKELFEVRKFKGEFENWALRPEGTASCMRAIKEAHFMQRQKEARFAYFAPMFRYNRPQKGRYRQFLHAGWEFIGQNGPYVDCELIIGAVEFVKAFGFEFTLEINSIGTAATRKVYRETLREYFKLDDTLDPLKYLDKAKDLSADTPHMKLEPKDAEEFATLLDLLEKRGIAYTQNPHLVRGLDYYNSTVFEIKTTGQTVLAGGRYDGLMEQIGGNSVPAVGWAAGVDRIVNHMTYEYTNQKIAIIPLDASDYALEVAERVRATYDCVIFWNLDLKKALGEADKQKYRYIIICGSKEAQSQIVTIKDLKNNVTRECALDSFFVYFY